MPGLSEDSKMPFGHSLDFMDSIQNFLELSIIFMAVIKKKYLTLIFQTIFLQQVNSIENSWQMIFLNCNH